MVIPLGPAWMIARPRKVCPVELLASEAARGLDKGPISILDKSTTIGCVSQIAQSSSSCAPSLAETLCDWPPDRLGAPFELGEIQLRRLWRDD
jgi:hypothetical protein